MRMSENTNAIIRLVAVLVSHVQAATHPWVSFIAIYGFAPRLPPPHRSGNLGEQRQQIENSSLWLWKEGTQRGVKLKL